MKRKKRYKKKIPPPPVVKNRIGALHVTDGGYTAATGGEMTGSGVGECLARKVLNHIHGVKKS